MTALRCRLPDLGFDERHESLGQRRARPLAMGHEIERPSDLEVAHLDAAHEAGAALVFHRALRDDRDADAGPHGLLDRLRGADLAGHTERVEVRPSLLQRALEGLA